MPVFNHGFIKSYYGLFSGIIIFFLVLVLIPEGFMPEKAQRIAAITLLMATWWITEAIPIPATALLPMVLYPALEIMKAAEVTINYGHHLVFLFLGGFIIALTIERWKLHKRIALSIIYRIGNNPRLIILGFMLATAFLSMWISNTATTMMMIPIGLAVILQVTGSDDAPDTFIRGRNNFALALMLGIAYAASIGGIATLIGTPPNVVFLGILHASFPSAPEVSFVQWMMFALPFSIVFLPLAWLYLVHIAAPVSTLAENLDHEVLGRQLKDLGPIEGPERSTLIVFITTGFLWIFRSDIDLGPVVIPGWASLLGVDAFVHDSTVAIAMALVTFIIPAGVKEDGSREFLMDWSCAGRIPWGILILFGGGFAIADGFQVTQLTQWLGDQLSGLSFLPLVLIITMVSAMTTLTTEFASNTAMATTILPIVAGLGVALGVNPMILMIPATISSSTAFMLPVATPPNAIVFGSGYIRIPDMVRAGIIMNIIGLMMILIFTYFLAPIVFGIEWNAMPAWIR